MSYIQSLYPPEHTHCFGCGPANPAGLQIQTHWDGEVGTCRYTPGPEYMAYPGVVYGGLIACLIDCHGIATAIAAAYQAEDRPMGSEPRINMVTGNLNVTYQASTPLGGELLLRAWVHEMAPKKVLVSCELSAEGEMTAVGQVLGVRLTP
ncbi:MAG: PaaI family thioesterase [Desulfarculaceae bacterium]|nr:PaaI family thioesterase [Desulfarculaceae bacterium]MCF8048591.1 PaaI family thioesterase [Desulfarculaceae bacterium]MCF8065390.1 PaaI family thioesterase [Desulfarculaceae bacterium]MCF8098195.1 PaaI family thioesterase [Desulfarculaceae bacterium]MCF8123187.1 PaaI family thioesterase [Desulfarculaceae bacterium]